MNMAHQWVLTDYTRTTLSLIAFFGGPWIIFEVWQEKRQDTLALTTVSWGWRFLVYAYLVVMLVFFPPPVPVEFIYFQF